MNVKKLVYAGLLTAIVTVLTLIVLPLPVANGYINLGDAGVYAAVGAFMGPVGVVCAGIGSMLADIILGYGIYAPATLVIKALSALVALILIRHTKGFVRFLSLLLAGVVNVVGYFLFEGIFICDSFGAALLNMPFNCAQALVGAVLGYVLIELMTRSHIDKKIQQ